jgi:hypothetical protein
MKHILFLIIFFLKAPVFSQKDSLQNPVFKVILVKLNTNHTQINALKQRGFYKEADKKTQALNVKNTKLRKAFTNFTNYPVYFFNSEFTDSIKYSKNISRFLLNIDSLPVTDTNHIQWIQEKNFLIGQMGSLKSTDFNFPCFYLADSKERTLKKPFKYYVRSHFFSFPISFKKIVDKLNYNLSLKR